MKADSKGKKREMSPFFRAIGDFFYPPSCDVCKACGREVLCPRCRKALEEAFSPKSFLSYGGNGFADGMCALFSFDSLPVKILLYDGKRRDYGHFTRIYAPFVEEVRRRELFPRPDLVSFAPRRPRAVREFGFDQGEALARSVAETLGVPFLPLLERRGHSRPQHRLKGEAREENVHGVFHPLRPLAGETILLVDDIVTTGASVRECARVLKGAGAQKVFVLAIAKNSPSFSGEKRSD